MDTNPHLDQYTLQRYCSESNLTNHQPRSIHVLSISQSSFNSFGIIPNVAYTVLNGDVRHSSKNYHTITPGREGNRLSYPIYSTAHPKVKPGDAVIFEIRENSQSNLQFPKKSQDLSGRII